ncbi:Melanocortin-2 receptor accessory protein 2B [Triplophysa tibetana]|uniref:Melanocortin-2 receptor accessory protein 2B n=1 Tax=Triplophysa tibetana TaxID=1572043 RepID=A0A5A9PGD1_9TELE|nr:Melanocortin-2 receptor accessory protein 2B [Triplophysa tibetana]
MTAHVNQSHSTGDYEWRYEYYDDEESVFFEGLKANRYSVVIGFWVGLAVFVIFMFFVLTLLTKTGAPHPVIPDPSEKHHGPDDNLLEAGCPQTFLLSPMLDESLSLFHFYIHEADQTPVDRDTLIGIERCGGREPIDCIGLAIEGERGNRDDHYLSNFSFPSFVQSEHSSSLDNDDKLACGLPVISDSQSPVINS